MPKKAFNKYGIIQGINDFGTVGYRGPSPNKGTQYYYFKVYGLSNYLNISANTNAYFVKKNILSIMK